MKTVKLATAMIMAFVAAGLFIIASNVTVDNTLHFCFSVCAGICSAAAVYFGIKFDKHEQ